MNVLYVNNNLKELQANGYRLSENEKEFFIQLILTDDDPCTNGCEFYQNGACKAFKSIICRLKKQESELSMCEPTHSISQFPPDDPSSGTPQGAKISALGRIMEFGRKIAQWFHWSKIGKGHHESFAVNIDNRLWMPSHTKYEALWWERKVVIDGPFCGESFEREEALQCASLYAQDISIGNLTVLRRFLESSLRATEVPFLYLERFFGSFLSIEGKKHAKVRLKKAVGHLELGTLRRSPSDFHLDRIIAVMMAMTRKREWLQDAWADLPGQLRVEG